ncbi:MAG: haloacid dehalogenase [Deltaproteobacteria bacterium]|nr:MAG: haloacid dehalogenase [Deltaproteobacteria bacterium]
MYRAIVFDLFDTLVDFNHSNPPSVEINGVEVKSISAPVYRVFSQAFGHMDFNRFQRAFIESYEEIEREKKKEYKELYAGERFRLMLTKLNIGADKSFLEDLVEDMVVAHMETIFNSVSFPKENRDILLAIKEKNYRIALLSNFDHAPTAYRILDAFGIKNFFDTIVISVEFGWRKPKPCVFNKVLSSLGVAAEEAIFVGDSFEADVIGAKWVGMSAIWVNKRNESLKTRALAPDYVVSRLPEIKEILL